MIIDAPSPISWVKDLALHLGKKAELPFSLNTDLSKGFTIAQRELTAGEGIGIENKEQVAVQITV